MTSWPWSYMADCHIRGSALSRFRNSLQDHKQTVFSMATDRLLCLSPAVFPKSMCWNQFSSWPSVPLTWSSSPPDMVYLTTPLQMTHNCINRQRHFLKKFLPPYLWYFSSLLTCITNLSSWMTSNQLKLNEDQQDPVSMFWYTSSFTNLHVARLNSTVRSDRVVRWSSFDRELKFLPHTSKLCACCFYYGVSISHLKQWQCIQNADVDQITCRQKLLMNSTGFLLATTQSVW